jgi:hypothetical protein
MAEEVTESGPRCGLTDPVGRARFTTLCSWDHPCLTYAFDTGTADVPGVGEFQAVRDAFATWAAATPLTFTEVGLHQQPDVVIGWRSSDDPDFDLSSKIAHADFPPGCDVVTDTLPKPVHFREDGVNWSVGPGIFSHDVESVALHELGHILGLGHSTVEDAVMFNSSFFRIKTVLTPDDLAGITRLYPAAIPQPGDVTIRQVSTSRLLDAHETASNDFRLVTRPEQGNDTQRWSLTPVGTVHIIRHKVSGRFLHAFGSGFEGADFRLVTRPPVRDDTRQRWIVVPAGDGSVTIRQLATNRFVDAHEIAEKDFAAVTRPRQHDGTQRWLLGNVGPNTLMLRQSSSGRFLDAHQIVDKDFAVVTRPAQTDQTQHWVFAPVGAVYTVRQRSSGRFVDAHETGAADFGSVTRPAQRGDAQRWVVVPSADGTCTIRQLSSGRLLDAYANADDDFAVVTRPPIDSPTRRWAIEPA